MEGNIISSGLQRERTADLRRPKVNEGRWRRTAEKGLTVYIEDSKIIRT